MGSVLPGQLVYVFFVSIVDAAILSWLALLWYRRTVRRLMLGGAAKRDGLNAAEGETASTVGGPDEPLGFALFQPEQGSSTRFRLLQPQTPLRRLAIAVLRRRGPPFRHRDCAQVGPRSCDPGARGLGGGLVDQCLACRAHPHRSAVLDRGAGLRLSGWYVLGGCAAVALVTLAQQTLRGAFNSAPLTNVFWAFAGLLWTAWVPLVLVWITGWRRVRAVTPLALASTLLFGFGLMLFREALTRGLNL